jgi:hypothetical protein
MDPAEWAELVQAARATGVTPGGVDPNEAAEGVVEETSGILSPSIPSEQDRDHASCLQIE